MKNPRQIVVEALCHMQEQKSWSVIVLNNTLSKQAELSPEDKSFASALFYGTLVRQYTIDSIIQPLSKRSIKKVDLVVLNILRTAIYQILYMDSVPSHSAVDEAVKLTRKMGKSSASGFVNAVLRGFLRTDITAQSDDLSAKYSCPPDLVNSFIADYGKDNAIKILEGSLNSPPVFLRINPAKTTVEKMIGVLEKIGINPIVVDLVPNCITFASTNKIYGLSEYKKGYFHVQDLSSQLSAMSVGAKSGEKILDCCAAPGGKSFVLAQEVGENGKVVACDIYPARVAEIKRRNERLGIDNIETKALDMTQNHESLGTFDRVLCDAPCSGYGTVRRRPEIKYTPLHKQKTLPKLQLELLNNAAKYCKKGGILVYSTCTLRKQENENIVSEFLKNNSDFSFTTTDFSLNNKAENTIFIDEHSADGFYIATMIHG